MTVTESPLLTATKTDLYHHVMPPAYLALGGSTSALRCGLAFFGADKRVFASDCLFDSEEGPLFIREGMCAIEDLGLDHEDARKPYFCNTFKLPGTKHGMGKD